MTRARELAVTYPSLPGDAPAAEVARVLAEEPVDAVFVEHHGQLQGVVTDLGLLLRLLPGYILEDPTLAQVLEESAAELLPPRGPRSPRSMATPPWWRSPPPWSGPGHRWWRCVTAMAGCWAASPPPRLITRLLGAV